MQPSGLLGACQSEQGAEDGVSARGVCVKESAGIGTEGGMKAEKRGVTDGQVGGWQDSASLGLAGVRHSLRAPHTPRGPEISLQGCSTPCPRSPSSAPCILQPLSYFPKQRQNLSPKQLVAHMITSPQTPNPSATVPKPLEQQEGNSIPGHRFTLKLLKILNKVTFMPGTAAHISNPGHSEG